MGNYPKSDQVLFSAYCKRRSVFELMYEEYRHSREISKGIVEAAEGTKRRAGGNAIC